MLEMRQTGEEIGYQLITIRKVIDQLELNFSKLAADFVKTDFWEEQGSASPYDWVRFNCHMTSNAAGDRVAVGELASNLPESIQAMDDGKIGFAHLTVMARTASSLSVSTIATPQGAFGSATAPKITAVPLSARAVQYPTCSCMIFPSSALMSITNVGRGGFSLHKK